MKKIISLLMLVCMFVTIMPCIVMAGTSSCTHNFVNCGTYHKCALCKASETHIEDSYGICAACGYCNSIHKGTWTALPKNPSPNELSGHCYLSTDTTITAVFPIINKEVYIDLNGYNLHVVNFLIINGGTFNIYDSGENGTISCGSEFAPLIKIVQNVNMCVYDVEFSPREASRTDILCIDNEDNNTVKFKNVKANGFVEKENEQGGLFCVKGNNTLEFTSCSFNNNKASSGGVLYIDGSRLDILDSDFTGNKIIYGDEYNCGGAIEMYNCEYSFTGCKFNNNEASNTSTNYSYGGAVYSENCYGTITDCEFKNNRADFGGGIYNYYSGLSLNSTLFDGNIAKGANDGEAGCGGAILAYGSSTDINCVINIDDCTFKNNKAYSTDNDESYCGALYSSSNAYFKMTNSKFFNNESYFDSAMASWDVYAEIDNCIIKDNATEYENDYIAVIYPDYYATLSNLTVTDNKGVGICLLNDFSLGGKNIIENNRYLDGNGKYYDCNLCTYKNCELLPDFDLSSRIGVWYNENIFFNNPIYFIRSATKDCFSSFSYDWPGYSLTKKTEGGCFYIGVKNREISQPKATDIPSYTYELDESGYTSNGKRVDYQWYNAESKTVAENKTISAASSPDYYVATITDAKAGDIIFFSGIDGGLGNSGVKVFLEGDTDNYLVFETFNVKDGCYIVEEDGTYYIGGVSIINPPEGTRYDLTIKNITHVAVKDAVLCQTNKYLENGNGNYFENGKTYICKASFMDNDIEDFYYYSYPVTINVIESKAVAAPAEKPVPTVFIGENKPIIKVVVDSDIFINEVETQSAIAPIIIENGRTYLGIRDMANVLGVAPEAIKWNDKTKTASITKSGATIEVTQGSKDIKLTYGGYIYTIENDASAINRNDRIYLPFRVLFQIFGYTVDWDNETRTITCK